MFEIYKYVYICITNARTMLLVECTCGALLANIEILYLRDLRQLCKEYNVDQEYLSNVGKHDKKFNEAREELINKYCDKHRLCCRMKLLGYVDIARLVR